MKTGDKVVCIDDSPCSQCGGPSLLREGVIYVVGSVWESRTVKDIILISVLGVSTPTCHYCPFPIGYRITRFRLLDEMKQQARKAIELNR